MTLPVGEAKTQLVRKMFDDIAPRYEFVNRLMTLGLDARWRTATVRDLRLPADSLVLDVATGTGDFVRELAKNGYRVVGTDLSWGMLFAGAFTTPVVQADASRLPFPTGIFDGLTCGYALRNFTDLAATFSEMARVTRPGGRISFLEVSEPSSAFLRLGFNLWFRRAVPLIGALVSDRQAYRYLPRSTAYLPPATVISEMLVSAGFTAVNHREILGGLSQRFIATRRA